MLFSLDFVLIRRCRSSRAENLDNVGIGPHTMEVNGGSRHHRHPLPPPPNATHVVNGNGSEHWQKPPNQQNLQDQVSTHDFSHLFLLQIVTKISFLRHP